MKKLLFVIGFIAMSCLAAEAQTYLRAADAIDLIKSEIEVAKVEQSVKISSEKTSTFTNSDHVGELKLRRAKFLGLQGLLIYIQEDGNNANTLERVLSADAITRMNMKEESTEELEEYLVGIITKTE